MVDIMRANAILRREKYEKRAYVNYDEVELFYLSMAKIAKRLPKAKEAKLRMEVCNKVSEAELAHLLEVESRQRQSEINQNEVLNNQNHSSLFQPPISTPYLEQSDSRSSLGGYSNYSDQSITSYSYEKQYDNRPSPNLLQSDIDHTNKYIEDSSSNQYQTL